MTTLHHRSWGPLASKQNVMQSKTIKHVMNKNGVKLAQLAREHGVSREDFVSYINDEAKLTKLFADMNTDNAAWFEKLKASAEKIGARVHMMIIDVDYSKSHNEAAMAGGPQTPSNYNVLKVADKYTSSEKGIVKETVILFNWPKGGESYAKAVKWGLENGLGLTTPHVPFAVGENHPRLNYDLGPNPMYVAETTGCTFGGDADACVVWFDDSERESNLHWQNFFGDGRDWFCFRKIRA
jgi:hypothetical protein